MPVSVINDIQHNYDFNRYSKFNKNKLQGTKCSSGDFWKETPKLSHTLLVGFQLHQNVVTSAKRLARKLIIILAFKIKSNSKLFEHNTSHGSNIRFL